VSTNSVVGPCGLPEKHRPGTGENNAHTAQHRRSGLMVIPLGTSSSLAFIVLVAGAPCCRLHSSPTLSLCNHSEPQPWTRAAGPGLRQPSDRCEVRDVSGMLVEGVFLVSGVVKTVFWHKKIVFFCFSPRTKESKAGFRGNCQIASCPYGNAENMFYNLCAMGRLVHTGLGS